MTRGYELGETLRWMYPDHTTIYTPTTNYHNRMSVIVQEDIDRFVSTNSHYKEINRCVFSSKHCVRAVRGSHDVFGFSFTNGIHISEIYRILSRHKDIS